MPRQHFIYDKNLKKVIPYKAGKTNKSASISRLYPFISEDFDGTPVEVKSRSHYRDLCKRYGVYATHEFGKGYNISEI